MSDIATSSAAFLPWLLAFAFAAAGIVNLLGIGSVRADFAHWGYPAWFHRLVGVVELLGAALLAWSPTRVFGTLGLLAIMAAAILTLLRHREGAAHLVPAIALSVLLILHLATVT